MSLHNSYLRHFLLMMPALVGSVALAGCSSGSNVVVSPEAGADVGPGAESGSDGGRENDASEVALDAPAAACVASSLALQGALDGSHNKSPNAMLAVQDATCGVRVFVSGDKANATTDSLFRIGSITKTFTSATILSLEKEGKLALTDPLSKWVPTVEARCPPAEKPMMPIRLGLIFHSAARARTSRMARCASLIGAG
ncbi:MAG: hypothetical protein NVS3B20_19320 [Polyangiales bacterium]